MSERTEIAWCDSTVNFWSGCTKVSAGCANCYAETLSNRFGMSPEKAGAIGLWGKGAPRRFHESAIKLAHKLNKRPWVCDECGKGKPDRIDCGWCEKPTCPGGEHHRRRVFSLSLGDWLDPEVPVEWLARMLDTIRLCDQVTWILVTKRPENCIEFLKHCYGSVCGTELNWWLSEWLDGGYPKNVIIMASVEDQASADERIPHLLRIPAVCRGLSIEPLLGPINFGKLAPNCPRPDIGWWVVGGESGPKARPCNVEWIRSLVRQGQSAGVPVFVKQLGSRTVGAHPGVVDWPIDRKGADPSEWPEDLRIRQFPNL